MRSQAGRFCLAPPVLGAAETDTLRLLLLLTDRAVLFGTVVVAPRKLELREEDEVEEEETRMLWFNLEPAVDCV